MPEQQTAIQTVQQFAVDNVDRFERWILWACHAFGSWFVFSCFIVGFPVVVGFFFRVRIKKMFGDQIAAINEWINGKK